MPLFSASEDFARRTLSAISGLLSRLGYMTSLRDKEGNYSHWGLARTHGVAAAAEAMRLAHVEVLDEVLRTPLSQLMQEVEDPQQVALGVAQVLLKEPAPLKSIVPPGADAATDSHAEATILALRALRDARNRQRTTHPTA